MQVLQRVLGSVHRPRTVAAALVPLTALAAGLLFATSARTSAGTDLRASRSQLTELIAKERDEVARTERRASGLRADVAQRGEDAARRDARVASERSRAGTLERAAGTTAVRGPSLTVTLDDAPPDAESENPNDLVIHQQDVQAVVNGLWAGGAEAMAVMGQRIISTSAVRCVGNTLLLHGRVYGPPFVITAVGDRTGMRDGLADEPGVRLLTQYVERFGLGYTVSGATDTELPAYTGPLEMPSVRGPA